MSLAIVSGYKKAGVTHNVCNPGNCEEAVMDTTKQPGSRQCFFYTDDPLIASFVHSVEVLNSNELAA